jgi:hypothetical protein
MKDKYGRITSVWREKEGDGGGGRVEGEDLGVNRVFRGRKVQMMSKKEWEISRNGEWRKERGGRRGGLRQRQKWRAKDSLLLRPHHTHTHLGADKDIHLLRSSAA